MVPQKCDLFLSNKAPHHAIELALCHKGFVWAIFSNRLGRMQSEGSDMLLTYHPNLYKNSALPVGKTLALIAPHLTSAPAQRYNLHACKARHQPQRPEPSYTLGGSWRQQPFRL